MPGSSTSKIKDPKVAWEDKSNIYLSHHGLTLSEMKSRVNAYNRFHEDTQLALQVGEEDGHLLLEGKLHIYWGVKTPIHFKKLDETSLVKDPKQWRRSYCMAISNGLGDNLKSTENNGEDKNKETLTVSAQCLEERANGEQFRYNTIGGGNVVRRKKAKRPVERRRSMINGHLYNLETSVFTPTDGSITTVNISSFDQAPAVIKLLLHKFKVENNPDEFCLCSVKKSGEVRVFKDTDCPLLERVLMGPLEGEAKIVIRDRSKVKDISDEVAQYMGLPETMLIQFLQKIDEDEVMERQDIIIKYAHMRHTIEKHLQDVETPDWLD